jgi:hypothetical protein
MSGIFAGFTYVFIFIAIIAALIVGAVIWYLVKR